MFNINTTVYIYFKYKVITITVINNIVVTTNIKECRLRGRKMKQCIKQ